MAKWKVCSFPGCPELVQGSTRCPEHTVKVDDSWRPNSAQRGYDAKWRRTRDAYLAANPDCQVLGCTRPATDVDHIDNQGPLGPRGYDWSNFRGLCHSHHSAKTAATTHAQRNTGSRPPWQHDAPSP